MANAQPSELGILLRQWRGRRGKSQLDLSLDTGVSQRHISFIESGRSIPSRPTLMGLAQSLEVPLRERNALLIASGYAPVYGENAWNDTQMQSIHKALERMLRQHEPFAAVVMDRHWNVLTSNQAAPRFFGLFTNMEARPKHCSQPCSACTSRIGRAGDRLANPGIAGPLARL
jgi:transcriptional regulator with XRE-family HTH domain